MELETSSSSDSDSELEPCSSEDMTTVFEAMKERLSSVSVGNSSKLSSRLTDKHKLIYQTFENTFDSDSEGREDNDEEHTTAQISGKDKDDIPDFFIDKGPASNDVVSFDLTNIGDETIQSDANSQTDLDNKTNSKGKNKKKNKKKGYSNFLLIHYFDKISENPFYILISLFLKINSIVVKT